MDRVQIDDPLLETAAAAALDGGTYAHERIDSVEHHQKADSTLVTDADKQIDRDLRERLTAETGFDVLSEEHGDAELLPNDSYWVVDPIDGTQNYAYQQPLYGTAVGLVQENEPTVGCFYMPEMDDLYYACSGEGAFLNDQRISVTAETDPTNAYLVGSGMESSLNHEALAAINSWVQRFGCAMQAEAYIAAGQLDAGVLGALKPWDVVAGIVLVREAGGCVRRLDADKRAWDEIAYGGLVLGNPDLADTIADQLSNDVIEQFCAESKAHAAR